MPRRSEFWYRTRAEEQMFQALTVAIEARTIEDPYYKMMYTSSAQYRLKEAMKALDKAEALRGSKEQA